MAPNTANEKLRHWAEKTTFHAIPNITTTDKNLVKVIWIVCFLASTCYCGYIVINNLVDFLKNEVNTVIDILRDLNNDFPTVTICTLNLCGIDNLNLESYKNLNLSDIKTNNTDQLNNMDYILEYLRNNLLLNNSSSDLINSLKQNEKSFKNFIINCKYGDDSCDENDFEYFKRNNFEKCYKFNSGKNLYKKKTELRKLKRYGKSYGLQLELVLNEQTSCNTPLLSTYGLMLYVHNYTNSVSDEYNGVQLSPGLETDVAVDRTYVSKMPPPYSDCIDNNDKSNIENEMAKKTYKITDFYTQQSCLQLCYQEYLVEKYECYDEYLPYYEQSKINSCLNKSDKFNNEIFGNKISPFYDDERNVKCLEQCPVECEYFTYKTSLSSAEFPTKLYEQILGLKLNISVDSNSKEKNSLKNSVLSVNVFYKSDLLTKIIENSKTQFGDLISNVGGTLGLFLGISLLTLVEFVELVFELCIIKYEKQKKKITPTQVIKVNSLK